MRTQQCKGTNHHTLHGLWPEWGQSCGGAQFDINELNPIMVNFKKIINRIVVVAYIPSSLMGSCCILLILRILAIIINENDIYTVVDSTKHSFRVSFNGVMVSFYDVGKDELRNEGSHTITFDASSLSSGVYFYRLEYDGKALVNKMILLK